MLTHNNVNISFALPNSQAPTPTVTCGSAWTRAFSRSPRERKAKEAKRPARAERHRRNPLWPANRLQPPRVPAASPASRVSAPVPPANPTQPHHPRPPRPPPRPHPPRRRFPRRRPPARLPALFTISSGLSWKTLKRRKPKPRRPLHPRLPPAEGRARSTNTPGFYSQCPLGCSTWFIGWFTYPKTPWRSREASRGFSAMSCEGTKGPSKD